MNFCVYVTFHLTGRYYVGKGRTEAVRTGKYRGSGTKLRSMMKKNPEGWETAVVRDGLTEDEAFTLEAEYVDENFLLDSLTLNMKTGGSSGSKVTDEVRLKISHSKTGVPRSEEARRRISEGKTGKKKRPLTAEQRLGFSIRQTGKKRGPYKKRTKPSDLVL